MLILPMLWKYSQNLLIMPIMFSIIPVFLLLNFFTVLQSTLYNISEMKLMIHLLQTV